MSAGSERTQVASVA